MKMITSHIIQRFAAGTKMVRLPPRSGYTLMEILLGVALISILAAGGMWLLFVQQGAYSLTSQRNDAMAKLTATYQLMFKEIHKQGRAAIVANTPSPLDPLPHDRVAIGPAAPYLFNFDSANANVLWNGNPVLSDVLATFTYIGAESSPNLQVVSVQLQHRSTGDRLNFLVAPRNP